MSDALLEVIDRIYEASLQPALWPGVMNRLADMMGGAEATLHFSDAASGARLVVAPRTDPDYLISYREHWVNANPLWRHGRAVPVGQLVRLAAFMPHGEFERTAFCNEWWAPQGLGTSGLGVNLKADHGAWAGCAVHPARHRPFKPEAEALFSLLCPHLLRAIDIHGRLADAAASRDDADGIERRIENLRRRFGLTPAEAAFALEIAKGDGREAAARRSGISVSTAHTHLNRIFGKTGTRRQAELVRLLLHPQARKPTGR